MGMMRCLMMKRRVVRRRDIGHRIRKFNKRKRMMGL
jgi:hypothetical protein